MSATIATVPDDEIDRYRAMYADLLSHGYVDSDHPGLRPSQRIRHRGERYPEAYEHGTAVILAVLECPDSAWSRSWGGRDIELIVLRDKPLFEGMSRLSQLANYHVATVVGAA